MATTERWAVHLTIKSSTKETIKENAAAEKRSISNYLSRLVEDDVAANEGKVKNERPSR